MQSGRRSRVEVQKVIEDLDNLANIKAISSNCFSEVHGDNLKIALAALEKQVPMKVIEGRFAGLYDCPKCAGAIESRGYQYCPSCGQKLDWRK